MNETINHEKNWSVYVHISPSHKYYVGITSQKPEDRWKDGYGYLNRKKSGNLSQPAMARAILKYGWDSFEHRILYCKLSKEEAERKEQRLIILLRSNDGIHGYNIQSGGKVCTHNEESRKRMSIAQSGSNSSWFGKHHTEEYKINSSGNTFVFDEVLEENKINIEDLNEEARLSGDGLIFCVELNQRFCSFTHLRNKYGIRHVSDVLKGRRNQKTAGKHPITGEPLHWKYIVKNDDTENVA